MSLNHPKFKGRTLTENEHDGCVTQLGQLYSRFVEPLLRNSGLVARGRLHPNPLAPCVYVFRHQSLFESERRGLLLHIQDTVDKKGIEIVFRRTKSFVPLSETNWRKLGPERWQPNKPEWKALTVRNESELSKAHHFLIQAIERYDQTFGRT